MQVLVMLTVKVRFYKKKQAIALQKILNLNGYQHNFKNSEFFSFF